MQTELRKISIFVVFEPLSPNSNQHLISPYNTLVLFEHSGHESKENDQNLKCLDL